MKEAKGKQSIEVVTGNGWFVKGTWWFCANGCQRTGVELTAEQFDMLKQLVASPEMVKYYKSLREIN